MRSLLRALAVATFYVVTLGLTGGCSTIKAQEKPLVQVPVEVIVEETPEPFDICAPTTGEASPDRMKGHAFESKPYGCM